VHSPGLACMSPIVDGDKALHRPHSDDATCTLLLGSPLTGTRSLGRTSDVVLPCCSCHVRACRGGCGLSMIVGGGGEWWQ